MKTPVNHVLSATHSLSNDGHMISDGNHIFCVHYICMALLFLPSKI